MTINKKNWQFYFSLHLIAILYCRYVNEFETKTFLSHINKRIIQPHRGAILTPNSLRNDLIHMHVYTFAFGYEFIFYIFLKFWGGFGMKSDLWGYNKSFYSFFLFGVNVMCLMSEIIL